MVRHGREGWDDEQVSAEGGMEMIDGYGKAEGRE